MTKNTFFNSLLDSSVATLPQNDRNKKLFFENRYKSKYLGLTWELGEPSLRPEQDRQARLLPNIYSGYSKNGGNMTEHMRQVSRKEQKAVGSD
jgi:hypothetical protein